MKVLIDLLGKVVGAGDTAGRHRSGETSLAAFLFAKLFLCAFGVKEKAGNGLKCTCFSVINIKFPPQSLTKYYKCKSFIRFFFDTKGTKKKLGKKKTPRGAFRLCGGGKRTCA